MKCDNCEAEEVKVIKCDDPLCVHVFCKYCVPVLCYCGKLIGHDPTKTGEKIMRVVPIEQGDDK
jgi:hypothetical protein